MKELYKQRLLELADKIESLPHEITSNKETFSMRTFWKNEDQSGKISCKTVSCIAGWAVALFAPEIKTHQPGFYFESVAAPLLGLDADTAMILFYATDNATHHKYLPHITPQEAARACRNVAEGAYTFRSIWDVS